MGNDNRRKPRYRVRFRVAINTPRGRTEGYVLDLSETGMRLQTDQVLDVWIGEEVSIEALEFGMISGKARWRAPGRLGVRFEESTNTSAKVQALQKYMRLQIA